MGLTHHLCHQPALITGFTADRLRSSALEASMPEPLLVQREIQIAAAPATVFAFLTDPEKIVSWMGTEATTEAQPGGLYLVKGARRTARGEFREVVPVHRLA